MDNPMFRTIPLEVAQEHFLAAATRSLASGKQIERKRIVELLKKNGHYEAVLTILKEDKLEKTNGK